jgi:hypothetical protein
MARGHVIVTLDDEDPLTTISLLIRVFKNVQHVSVSDEEHDLFEPDAAIGLQLLVFRVVCFAKTQRRVVGQYREFARDDRPDYRDD